MNSGNYNEEITSGHLLLNIAQGNLGPSKETFSENVVIDLPSLGRQMVAKILSGKVVRKSPSNHYNIVTKEGLKVRAFTRILRENQGYHRAFVSSCELAPINFSKKESQPDVIAVVVVNPVTSSVDVFHYPVKEESGVCKKVESININFSTSSGNYNSAELHKVASFS